MADNIFQDIAANKPTSIQPGQVVAARQWFREAAQKVRDINPATIFKQNEKNLVKTINVSSIGSMFLYVYDPRWKEKLPYYDTHPLIFVEGITPDGWTGLNLHYLPPWHRAKLMNSLYDITIKETDKMKVQMSYSLLNSASKFSLFKPCYKRYLARHVQSRILFIEQSQWDTAMMLPLANFQKATQEEVWKDSRIK